MSREGGLEALILDARLTAVALEHRGHVSAALVLRECAAALEADREPDAPHEPPEDP